jgi:hypothetical protein
MTKGLPETYETKRDLVALFKEQVAILKELTPAPLRAHLESIDVGRYDQLLAQGPQAQWPKGALAGLREGIRDVQMILETSLPPEALAALKQRLTKAAGSLVTELKEEDAHSLESIRERGRIESDDEYYLVRTEIDRLESSRTRDEALLHQLYKLVDK